MNIKGIQKTSLVDFPGRLSTVLFSSGCNLRCKYCHNPDLVWDSSSLQAYTDDFTLEYIRKRSSLIEGIVISGGEPTFSSDLETFIQKIKNISMSVKLDTNGCNPEVIERLLEKNLLDYVAIDVKTSPEKYELLTGKKVNFYRIKGSIEAVRDSGVDYELRTTCIPYYVTLEDFSKIKMAVGNVKKYYLQQFVNNVTLDKTFQEYKPYSELELNEFREFVKTFSDECKIRGV